MLFKVDENLPLAVRDVLRAAGHDASTVFEQGLAQLNAMSRVQPPAG